MRILHPLLLRLGLTVWLCVPHAAHADQLDDILAAQRLKVAIINGLPNFSYTDGQRGFIGSDVETAELVAKDLGVQVEFVKVPNADRIDAMLAKRADVIISALSITAQREQIISYSIPYSQIALVVAAPKSMTINSYRDLAGRRIGVGSKTSNGELLKKNAPDAAAVEYPDEPSLLTGYLREEFEIISSQRANVDELNRLAPARQLEEKFIQHEFDVAIGIRKEEKRLRSRVNAIVAKRLADGTLNEIFRRYHRRDLPESVLPTTLRLKDAK
jgi:polar amino acid transport system substrate-binding protein